MKCSGENCPSLLSNFPVMKKLSLLLLCQVVVAGFLNAQTEYLFLKSGSKGLYVEHKITPKENFYSIGRLFNVSPKHLAAFNSLDMSKGLSIGQEIMIPLSDTNFSQNVNEGIPVYTIAGEKENLSKISSRNNKVSIENLKAWNNLSGDNVTAGAKLVAGFLTTGEIAKENNIVIPKKEEAVNKTKTGKPEESKTEIKKEETKEATKPEIRKEEAKETVKPVSEKIEAVKNNVKTDETKTAGVEKPVNTSNSAGAISETTATLGKGYFKNNFEQQIKAFPLSKEATLTSGIFKTINGWTDEKYYALMDGVDPGTVIMVTNPSNEKIIYAKVLGAMNGIRQNQGLELRISDAAASRLDIQDTGKFVVKVNF